MGLIESGSGVWHALVFTVSFLTITLAVYILSRLLFSRKHKKGAQQKAFFSGNEIPEDTHLAASNLYWGFTTTLKRYYDKVIPEHTGNINDYIGWFVIVAAIIMMVLAIGGMA